MQIEIYFVAISERFKGAVNFHSAWIVSTASGSLLYINESRIFEMDTTMKLNCDAVVQLSS